jgi:cysteinyl-tRNA synthetase
MVGPVIFDTIKRYLVYCGYTVEWVVNITDVDDKLIAESKRRGISMSQVATQMTGDYMANLIAMGVDQIDKMPRATDFMDEIIAFIQELVDKGYAYENGGDVFFDVTRDDKYGQLSNRSADAQQGEGGDAAAKKRSASDFALWKSAKPDDPSWESPWGRGRPGWHIECSAMSHSILGKTFDIHGGGLDLLFPHHENELAQSRCCHDAPMVRYWMHNGLMRAASSGKVGGRSERENAAAETDSDNTIGDSGGKISRSKGAGGLADLIAAQTGERIRFFLLRTHYRSTNIFGEEQLSEAGAALETFYRLFERFERITNKTVFDVDYARTAAAFEPPVTTDETLVALLQLRASFQSKMDDDFNTGGATSDLFEMARTLNKSIDAVGLEESKNRAPEALRNLEVGISLLRESAALLGLFLKPVASSADHSDSAELVDGLMQLIIQIRADARKNKNFDIADTVRDGLNGLGVTLQDLKEGTTWSQE